MKKTITILLVSSFALSGCTTLVENDIFTPQKPDPNEAYEDANKTDELTRCLRDKKRKEQEPECYLKNR